MKKYLNNLDVATALLIFTTITSCFIKNSYHITLTSLGFLAYKLADRYLTIINIQNTNVDKFDSIDEKIVEMDAKLAHLTSKDAIKEVFTNMSNQRKM